MEQKTKASLSKYKAEFERKAQEYQLAAQDACEFAKAEAISKERAKIQLEMQGTSTKLEFLILSLEFGPCGNTAM